jgi:hypothetical protein
LGQCGSAFFVADLCVYKFGNDEEAKMRMRKELLSSAGRSVALATIAVLAVTMSEPPLAIAGPAAPASKAVSAATASSGATDFSSVRRRYYRGGNAAGLAFMGMAIGTIGAIAAQQQRYDYYNSYGYAPGYYGGGPYGGGPYYGRRNYYVPY